MNLEEESEDDEMCVWKEMFKDTNHLAEGRLRHCQLYCNGLQKGCRYYDPMKDFNEYKQI